MVYSRILQASKDFLSTIEKHMHPVKYPFEDKTNRMQHDHKHIKSIPAEELNKIHSSNLGELFDFSVWAVDGEIIRDEVDIDFVAGGNPARYAYVPENEIWIEKNLSPADAAPTILHEIIEVNYMLSENLSYNAAHNKANKAEKGMRETIDHEKFIVNENPVEAVKRWLDL